MADVRKGRQTPTRSVVLPYEDTKGPEAIALYEETGRTAQEWQELQIYDIMAANEDGLWIHTKYGIEMANNNAANVSAGKPKVSGAIFRAPIGTTVPTTAVAALDDAFVNLGFVSVDGVTNSDKNSSKIIKDWGGVSWTTWRATLRCSSLRWKERKSRFPTP